MKNNYLSQLNDIKSDCSRQIITILRAIIISYCALAWVELGSFKSPLCLWVIINTMLYFSVDIVSYLASTVVSRSNFIRFESGEVTKRGVKRSMHRLDKFTYVLLWIRIIILFVDTVLLTVYFLKEM